MFTKKRLALTLVLFLFEAPLALASDEVKYKCDFSIYLAPFATLEFSQFSDGELSEAVRVTMQGRTHLEGFNREPIVAAEKIHASISRDSSENPIELFVENDLKARMLNPQMPPAYRLISGNCQILE